MEERILKSEERVTSGADTCEVTTCAVCGGKESRGYPFTWQLTRQDVELENEGAVKDWMELRKGVPTVLVLPDDGGVIPYSVDPFCDGCLDENWREYEECHTPADKLNRATLLEQIRAFCSDPGWDLYTLQRQYLCPRAFPNLAVIRDEGLVLLSVRGHTTARRRAYQPRSHHIFISPEVPKDTRETLLRDPNEGLPSEKVAFLYMDEKYPETKDPPSKHVTSLTGLVIASDQFISFRDAFFRIVPGFDQGSDNFPLEIHAGNLFPGRSDEEHFQFYSELVQLVNDFRLSVYRRGFNFMPAHELLRKKQKDLLGQCFRSLLLSVEDYEHFGQIWPVMEFDGSKEQDENFAGYKRWVDQATAFLNWSGGGVEELIDDDYMVDNSRFGDLHYVTKRSVGGIAVDCLAYLLHCKWLDQNGLPITRYKARLAAIASALNTAIVDDYVGSFRLDNEPESPDSRVTGPEKIQED